MKKWLFIFISVLAIIGILVIVNNDASHQPPLSQDALNLVTVNQSKNQSDVKASLIASKEKKSYKEGQFAILPDEACMDFRNRHPQQETAFNELMADIYMSDDDARGTSIFSNMDMVSLKALANGGDKDALFFLGDNQMLKAIFGKDWYGPVELRNKPSNEEIEAHKIDKAMLKEGEALLFKAAIHEKLGGFLSLKMNNDFAARQLIRTEPEAEAEINNKLADMMAYNRLLGFIHKLDEPFRIMFVDNAKSYDNSQLQKHYKNWKPDLSEVDYKSEMIALENLAEKKYYDLKSRWIRGREFYGFEVHPKLLSGACK